MLCKCNFTLSRETALSKLFLTPFWKGVYSVRKFSLKGSTLKRNNFLPFGAICFFQKWVKQSIVYLMSQGRPNEIGLQVGQGLLSLQHKVHVKLNPNTVKDRFLKGDWHTGKQTGNHNNYLPCQKWREVYQVFPFTLRTSSEAFRARSRDVTKPVFGRTRLEHISQLMTCEAL